MPPPVRVELRGELVADATTATIEAMGESDLTPAEALAAAELTLWHFIEKSMQLAASDELRRMAKQVGLRITLRMSSRIEAWPAEPARKM